MIVRYVADLPAQRRRLTTGADYVVLAISAHHGQSHFLIAADGGRPVRCEASHFDLVSPEVPSSWRIRVGHQGDCGRVDLAPGPFLEPGFFDAFWGDGDEAALEAQEVFRREAAIILEETGGPPS